MRKHFLILMLLTLLPLAGWAQTATFGEMTLGKYTYGDAAYPVPQVKDHEGAILEENNQYTVTAGAFYDEACEQAIPATDAARKALKTDGTKYYRKVEGKAATPYAGQTATAWFTVAKAELTLTYVAGALNRTYGEKPKDVAKNKFSITSGLATWDNATVLKGSNPTYSTADNNAGVDKKVTWIGGYTADNYTIKYADYTLTISPKAIGSSAPEADRATITVEQPNIVYTGEDIIGVYTIKDGTKTLTAGTPAVLYGSAAEYNAAKGTTLDDGDFAALTYAQKTKVAGTGDYWVAAVRNVDANAYKPTITFQNNYSGTMTPAVGFKVTPAPIVVSIDDIEKTYDGTNWKNHNFATPVLYANKDEYNADHDPDIDDDAWTAMSAAQKTKIAAAKFNYSGLVGDDLADAATIATIKASFTAPTFVKITTDAQDVKAGGYNLTISGAVGAGNYEIAEYIPGKLIIKQAKLELKAKDANKGIGADDPEFELDATANLVAGHVITGVTFTREGEGTVAGENAGTYAITPDYSAAKVYSNFGILGQKEETGNYEFAVAATKGQLTIGKSTIYVTIKDKEKFYGQADPKFEAVVTGLIGEDQLGDFTITRAGAGTAAGENVGSYALTAEVANPNTDRYAKVVVANGILTINKAKLTFTIPAQNVVGGNKKTALKKDNITVAGIFKDADKGTGSKALYTLDFNGVTLGGTHNDEITGEDLTYATGIIATLTLAAQANYVVDGDNKLNVDGDEEYEAATGKLIVNAGTDFPLNFRSSDATTSPAYVGDYTLIKEHAGETQNVTIDLNKRTVISSATSPAAKWNAQTWNTLVLPFDIEVSVLSQKFGYAIVNVLDKANTTGRKVAFKIEMGTIPANTPFTIKTAKKLIKEDGDAAGTYVSETGIIDFGKQLVKAPTAEQIAGADAGNGCLFVPAYQTKTIDYTMPDLLFLMGVQNKWNHVTNSTTKWNVVPFAAYMDLTNAGVSASEMIFTFQEADGSTTAIKAVDMDFAGSEKSYNVDGWYTLNGVKLQGAPTEKGVYINNGKKVVIK